MVAGAEEEGIDVDAKRGTLHYLRQYCSSNSESCRHGHQLCVCVCVHVCVHVNTCVSVYVHVRNVFVY